VFLQLLAVSILPPRREHVLGEGSIVNRDFLTQIDPKYFLPERENAKLADGRRERPPANVRADPGSAISSFLTLHPCNCKNARLFSDQCRLQ